MKIVPVPCLSDNYAYLLVCERTNTCAVVDASEAEPVLAALAKQASRAGEPTKLVAILATHHHPDHVGGNAAVVAKHPGVAVYGHASDAGRLPGLDHPLEDGDAFTIGELSVRALHIPGHTTGAVAYYVTEAPDDPAVFTGDTMFVAGCGRLFEGTPAMMHASLAKLAALPDATRVYCGHEYTESNLRFAKHVEPENPALEEAAARARALRAAGEPTVPSRIGDEKRTNPFLRVDAAAVRRSVGVAASAPSDEALGAIRKAKDGFRG